jgi:membrane-associated protease RseP (regulator of RpoE activity)
MAAERPAPVAGRLAVHAALLLCTLLTTTVRGALDAQSGVAGGLWAQLTALSAAEIARGLMFSLPLCFIIFCHEMGHYLAARYHRVDVSLPYFLPVPFVGIGTLGAVIKIRSPIPSRAALLDIGIAGPLAGLVVALPFLVIGLLKSPVLVNDLSGGKMVLQEGQSLLYGLLKLGLFGEWLPAAGGLRDVSLHPMAFAGWFGLLLTMINLIPIAQLDGGHILYALIGERHRDVTDWLHRALFMLGLALILAAAVPHWHEGASKALWRGVLSGGSLWLVFGGVLGVLRRIGDPYHPPVGLYVDETSDRRDPGAERPLGPGRSALAIFAMILLVLLFMPAPMRFIAG